MNAEFKVTCYSSEGAVFTIDPVVEVSGDDIRMTIPREKLCSPRLNKIRVETNLTRAKVGDEGYMFYPTNFGCAFVMTKFTERKVQDYEFESWLSATPVCGICENENALFCRVDKEAFDARFYVTFKNGIYSICPEFLFDGDEPDEDVVIVYHRMPGASYSDMARYYRQYQMDYRGCVPLKERVKRRDALRRAAEGMELRIRMGWKPIPTPVRHQTLENEPPMYVACDIAELNKIIDKMHEMGVGKAELCLVGWGPGGHDGRFPQQYPSDPRFGGDDELRKFIAKAQGYGYQVVCHTVSFGAYEIANNFDRDLLVKTKALDENGEPAVYVRTIYKKNGLNGGEPYCVCPKHAYETYAVKDLPVVRGYGFEGLHYIDELTAYVPEKCYDKKHPGSRRDNWKYNRKLAQLSRDLFGGYQSEGYMDYMNADLDAILYVGCITRFPHPNYPIVDRGIPFWQLVYHGIVLSNPTSSTVNYPIKDRDLQLKFFEYGGRPVMYFNSKFGEDRNWMGDVDLFNKTDEEIEDSVRALKRAYDDYEALLYLQYEFMDDHRMIAPKVYRTTYSDGSVMTCDYNNFTYTLEKPGEEARTVEMYKMKAPRSCVDKAADGNSNFTLMNN